MESHALFFNITVYRIMAVAANCVHVTKILIQCLVVGVCIFRKFYIYLCLSRLVSVGGSSVWMPSFYGLFKKQKKKKSD